MQQTQMRTTSRTPRGCGCRSPWSWQRQIRVHWWRSCSPSLANLVPSRNFSQQKVAAPSMTYHPPVPSCSYPLIQQRLGVKTKYCHQRRSTKPWRYTTQEIWCTDGRPLCVATVFWNG